MRAHLGIHHPAIATATDHRSNNKFVTLEIGAARDDLSISLFFSSRSELLVWLEQAKLAAIQLPDEQGAGWVFDNDEIGVPV